MLMSISAAQGLAQLRRGMPKALRMLPIAGVAIIGRFELWLPPGRVLLPLERPMVYEQIATRPGAVADLPLDVLETSRTLRNQMVHGQPIVGGFIARRREYDSFKMPLLHAIGTNASVAAKCRTDRSVHTQSNAMFRTGAPRGDTHRPDNGA